MLFTTLLISSARFIGRLPIHLEVIVIKRMKSTSLAVINV